jgi:hypothetical protein
VAIPHSIQLWTWAGEPYVRDGVSLMWNAFGLPIRTERQFPTAGTACWPGRWRAGAACSAVSTCGGRRNGLLPALPLQIRQATRLTIC